MRVESAVNLPVRGLSLIPRCKCATGGFQRSSRATPAPALARSRRALRCEARKVALLGAAGGIGQPLALLLKMNKFVTELALYDIANVEGVAADLSHCNTPVKASVALRQPAACMKISLLM